MADKPAAAADSSKKMNPQVAALIKNQFWILGGIAIVAAVAVWYMGTDALDQQFIENKRKIDSQFAMMKGLDAKQGVNALPSQNFTTKVNADRKRLTAQVVAAWNNLYDRQFNAGKSKIDFLAVNPRVSEIRELILMEPDEREELLKSKTDLRNTVNNLLQSYHNNQMLDEDFTQLFSLLNLRHTRAIDIFGRPIPMADPADKSVVGVLVWASTSGKPSDIRDRYRTRIAPGIDRIAVTYEDMWVFRSMFTAIQTINSKPIDSWLEVMKGKTPTEAPVDQANVPIKRIEYCDLAQRAMSTSFDDAGVVDIIGAGAGAETMGTQMGGDGGSAFNVTNEGTREEEQLLLKGRYLDGRNAQVTDPSNPPFTEFRQMYVQMRVLMDQRLIPVLITECANAPLPIETRQVRITMETTDAIRKAAAVGGEVNSVQQSPHDAIVTVRGVVFIYTKPDDAKAIEEGTGKLGKGADPEPAKRDFGIPKKAQTTDASF